MSRTQPNPPEALHAYLLRYPGEGGMVMRSLELLGDGFGLARSNFPAHVTASVLIRQGDALLTIFHPYLKQWLQPGGHIDPGEDPLTAALREAREETGWDCVLDQADELPWDIDCLFVPANAKKNEPDHWHIDFRYLMRPVALSGDPELASACIPLRELGAMTPSLARLAVKMLAG